MSRRYREFYRKYVRYLEKIDCYLDRSRGARGARVRATLASARTNARCLDRCMAQSGIDRGFGLRSLGRTLVLLGVLGTDLPDLPGGGSLADSMGALYRLTRLCAALG
jgi:hypothetical protein